MSDIKKQNGIELNNGNIKLNGVSIDPSRIELIAENSGMITIKLELIGFVEFSDVDLKYDV